MSYAFVLVLPREAKKHEERVIPILASAWSKHGPNHRGVTPAWTPSIESDLKHIERVFDISEQDALLLAKFRFSIPPEASALFLSRTPWAQEHTRPFFAELHAKLTELKPSLSIGVWNAPLRRNKRCPALSMESEYLTVVDFLSIEPNQLVPDVRA